MTAPLTPEEKRKRIAALRDAANPRWAYPKQRLSKANVSLSAVKWPRVDARGDRRTSESASWPSGGVVTGHMPVERSMLNEQAWISEHPLGEKA